MQRVTDCGAAKLQTRFSETIWVGWAGDNKHHLEIEVIGWECRKGFEMCAVGGKDFFLCFWSLGYFDFLVGGGFCCFLFFTEFSCLCILCEFTEWGFLLCCQEASVPRASALSCCHWLINLSSVSGCQNRGRGGQSRALFCESSALGCYRLIFKL